MCVGCMCLIKHFYKRWFLHHRVISRIEREKIFRTGPSKWQRLKNSHNYCYCGYYHLYHHYHYHCCAVIMWLWEAGRVGNCRWGGFYRRTGVQPDSPLTHVTLGWKGVPSGYLQSRLLRVAPTSFTETGQMRGLTILNGRDWTGWCRNNPVI